MANSSNVAIARISLSTYHDLTYDSDLNLPVVWWLLVILVLPATKGPRSESETCAPASLSAFQRLSLAFEAACQPSSPMRGGFAENVFMGPGRPYKPVVRNVNLENVRSTASPHVMWPVRG